MPEDAYYKNVQKSSWINIFIVCFY